MSAITTTIRYSVPARLLPILGVVALAAGVYWPSSAALYAFWTDFENLGGTHGFLIAAVSLWLVFEKRRELAAAPARFSYVGAALLPACSVCWAIFWGANLQDLHVFLLPALIWLAVLAAYGLRVARVLAFPLAYLYIATPIWGHLAGPLQSLTIHAVGALAMLAGLPAYIEGDMVTIPEGVFQIAGGCSGEHFFVVGLALAALLGEIEHASLKRRVMLLGVMCALALVCNWVRVFTIIMAGHYTNMQHPLITRGHYWFGWILFAAICALFLWLAGKLPTLAARPPNPSPAMPSSRPGTVPFLATALMLVAAPVAAYVSRATHDARSTFAVAAVPSAPSGWQGPLTGNSESSWQPTFAGADAQSHATYRGPAGQSIELVTIVYLAQRQGAELVGEANSLPGPGLQAEGESTLVSGGGAFRESVLTDSAGHRSIVWWVYDIGGQPFVVPLLSQLWYGLSTMTGAPRSALVAYRAPCEPSCEQARTGLADFVHLVTPAASIAATITRAE